MKLKNEYSDCYKRSLEEKKIFNLKAYLNYAVSYSYKVYYEEVLLVIGR